MFLTEHSNADVTITTESSGLGVLRTLTRREKTSTGCMVWCSVQNMWVNYNGMTAVSLQMRD
uniref:Uncharacterized protein n=1 Tax=Anguilla anguilla TaxID=7936 RepID=A0A0E9WEP8_ANGAN